jgi:hypothetical protein
MLLRGKIEMTDEDYWQTMYWRIYEDYNNLLQIRIRNYIGRIPFLLFNPCQEGKEWFWKCYNSRWYPFPKTYIGDW